MPTTPENAIGNRLKKFLDKCYPSLSERARSGTLGIPNSTVRGWINGRDISSEGLLALSKAGCDLNWLFTGKNEQNNRKSPTKGVGDDEITKLFSSLAEGIQILGDVGIALGNGKLHPSDFPHEYSAALEILRKAHDKRTKSDTNRSSSADTNDTSIA